MLPPAVRGSVHDTSVAATADAVTPLLAKKVLFEQATPPTVIIVDSLKFEPVMSRVLLPPSMGHTEELQDVLVAVTVAGSTSQDCSLVEPCVSTDLPRGHFVQFSSEVRPTETLNVPSGHKSQPKSDVRPGVPLHFPFEHLPVQPVASEVCPVVAPYRDAGHFLQSACVFSVPSPHEPELQYELVFLST